MPRINMPTRQPQEDPLDKVIKGLSIANSIFGMRADLAKVEEAKRLQADAAVKKQQEAENFKNQQINFQNQQTEFAQKQASQAPLNDPNSAASKTYREQLRAKGVNVPDDSTAAQNSALYGSYLKEREKSPVVAAMEAERLAKTKKDAEDAAFAKTPKGKLDKMPAAEKQRYDNVVMALGAVTDMENALANGTNTFSLMGDNEFTLAANNFQEALGRMQSGGAIGKDELKTFQSLRPRPTDSADIQYQKIQKMRDLMEQRFQTLGFEKGQAQDLGLDPTRLGFSKNADVQAPAPRGSFGNEAKAATPQLTKQDLSKMSDADLASLHKQVVGKKK